MEQVSLPNVSEYLDSEVKLIEHTATQLMKINSGFSDSLQRIALNHQTSVPTQEKENRVNLFRDSAIALEKIDINSAYALMKLAHKLRPNGPYIKEKFEEWSERLGITILDIYEFNNVELTVGETPPPALQKALMSGSYEKNEVSLLHQFLVKGEIVLELGAGIGFMGISAMKTDLCDRYVAYEANPKLIPVILDNMDRNKVSFELHNQLLVDGDGSSPFYITPAFWSSSLVKPTEGNYEVVNVKTVDKNQVIRSVLPSMLIVDIEGGEAVLFNDLDLNSVNKIILEIHPRVLSDQVLSDIYKTLLTEGFILNFNQSFKNVLYWSR
ncbi:MAG: FkbM family methyltransferase [Amphritea sp.]|nr:FkbM family methyltransferase [Amphritea sp.]MBQ0783354.1 FkbM family methyltransferase [Amphritea sp.]